MSTPRPRPTVVTSPRSEITSPLSSTRRNGVSTTTSRLTEPIVISHHPVTPSVTGLTPRCRLEGKLRPVPNQDTGPSRTKTPAHPDGETPARLEARHVPGSGPVRPPVNFPAEKPGGTCMANRPANAGAHSAGPQPGMPQGTQPGMPQGTQQGLPPGPAVAPPPVHHQDFPRSRTAAAAQAAAQAATPAFQIVAWLPYVI